MEKLAALESQDSNQDGCPWLYHLHTAFLFIKSDIKTTVFPALAFAIASATSGAILTTNGSPSFEHISLQLPKALLWTVLNLWVFNLANQRLPQSAIEDSWNKPWRPIPARRITPTQARHLLLLSIPAVLLISYLIGGGIGSAIIIILTWLYNDLEGGNEHWLIRHLLNALGFASFGAGASQVVCGFPQHSLNATAYVWIAMVATIITFTIQYQDMEDQEGDRLRNRKTLPLVAGDVLTRRLNAVTIVTFSLISGVFWRADIIGYILPLGLGTCIATRTLLSTSVSADRTTFKLWCLWLMMIYMLPIMSHPLSIVYSQ